MAGIEKDLADINQVGVGPGIGLGEPAYKTVDRVDRHQGEIDRPILGQPSGLAGEAVEFAVG